MPAWALTSLLYEKERAAPIEEIRQLIVANPAVITDVSCTGGRTALIEAAVREHVEAVALILEKGAAVEATDDNEWTALHWAGQKGNAAIATLLLAKGANVHARTKHGGRTPAHLAAEQSKPDVLRVLAGGGADMNAKETNEGLTPLHTAVHWERVSVAKTLLELGADPMAKDARGELAVNLAHRLYCTIVLYPGHVHAMRKVFLEFQQQKNLKSFNV